MRRTPTERKQEKEKGRQRRLDRRWERNEESRKDWNKTTQEQKVTRPQRERVVGKNTPKNRNTHNKKTAAQKTLWDKRQVRLQCTSNSTSPCTAQ